MVWTWNLSLHAKFMQYQFRPSYFPKFMNFYTLDIKKSRQWAIFENLVSRAWKNSAHALQPESFNSCRGWYRGFFTGTRLNFMPGMCRAWNPMISRLVHGNEVEFHARHEVRSQPISCRAWNLVLALSGSYLLDERWSNILAWMVYDRLCQAIFLDQIFSLNQSNKYAPVFKFSWTRTTYFKTHRVRQVQ